MQVIVPGGIVRFHRDSLEGEVTLEQMRSFFADVMICSCGGIAEDGAVSESTVAQCAVKQGMMAQSGLRILVVDHSKIGERRAFRIGSIADFDILVCDADPGERIRALCEEQGVRLICRTE